jgi:hypothetical protein
MGYRIRPRVEGRRRPRQGRQRPGEFFFEIRADEKTGVIDMLAGPDESQLALFPSRVVALPGGRTALTFTMFKAPDQPDELFESQYASLRREFANIEREFAAG